MVLAEQRQIANPRNIYPGKAGNVVFALGVAAFVFFIFCAGYLLFNHNQHPVRCILIGAVWVVGVPVYFFIEHLFIFRNYGNQNQYEQFTRVQDLAAKIWAAAILVLAACYLNQFPAAGG